MDIEFNSKCNIVIWRPYGRIYEVDTIRLISIPLALTAFVFFMIGNFPVGAILLLSAISLSMIAGVKDYCCESRYTKDIMLYSG